MSQAILGLLIKASAATAKTKATVEMIGRVGGVDLTQRGLNLKARVEYLETGLNQWIQEIEEANRERRERLAAGGK